MPSELPPSELTIEFQPELIASSAFIAPGAIVLGRVAMGENSSIWFGSVLRGDTESIHIGSRSNIQDLSVVHADPGFPATIGDDVTVGHGAVIHGARVEDGAMIGIRATVLNGAVVGAGSIIGAGAVVTEGSVIPAGCLALGIPAKVVRPLNDQDRQRTEHAARHYAEASRQYGEKTGFASRSSIG